MNWTDIRLRDSQRYWWKGELLPESPPDFGFGSDVSIDGGTALVGSFNQGSRNVTDWTFLAPIGGSAQVFVRPNATLAKWQREAVLVFNDGGGPYQGKELVSHCIGPA